MRPAMQPQAAGRLCRPGSCWHRSRAGSRRRSRRRALGPAMTLRPTWRAYGGALRVKTSSIRAVGLSPSYNDEAGIWRHLACNCSHEFCLTITCTGAMTVNSSP